MKNYAKHIFGEAPSQRKTTRNFLFELKNFDEKNRTLYRKFYSSKQNRHYNSVYALILVTWTLYFIFYLHLASYVKIPGAFNTLGILAIIANMICQLIMAISLMQYWLRFTQKYDIMVYNKEYKGTMGQKAYEDVSDYDIQFCLLSEIFRKYNKHICYNQLKEMISLLEKDCNYVSKPKTISMLKLTYLIAGIALPVTTSLSTMYITNAYGKEDILKILPTLGFYVIIAIVYIYVIVHIINLRRKIIFRKKHDTTLIILNDLLLRTY